jgi:intein-encoded DNA endonuclease-like protein
VNIKYNREFKKIDTQEKAYFLGFMYGDGTISAYTQKDGKIRYQTKVSIHENDDELILMFMKNFPFFSKGSFDYSKYNANSGIQSSISSHSKELFHDLQLNGLYPRKSYENANKLKFPNINKGLIPHFIRGFFDADGSVYTRASRKNLITIEFCSVSKDFLFQMNSYLNSLNINSWKIRSKEPKGKGKQTLYQLSYIRTSEIQKLINFLYNDSTISLNRKRIKCLEYVPINKVIDRNIICPTCGSIRNWVNGSRTSKKRGTYVRYECQNCGKVFS